MSNDFDDFINKTSFVAIIVSIFFIFLSGLFFGFTYYIMDQTYDAFQATDCVIENNTLVGSCQELWALSIYPFLNLRELFVWANFFFIFAMTLGMLILGYKSGKNPVLMGLLVIFVIVLTYVAIEISNIYNTMLQVEVFRNMMVNFTVYNKIMLNFPWFTFIVGLLSVMLSVVNFQRTKVNLSTEELDY